MPKRPAHQRPSEVVLVRGHQRPSEAIRGHQRTIGEEGKQEECADAHEQVGFEPGERRGAWEIDVGTVAGRREEQRGDERHALIDELPATARIFEDLRVEIVNSIRLELEHEEGERHEQKVGQPDGVDVEAGAPVEPNLRREAIRRHQRLIRSSSVPIIPSGVVPEEGGVALSGNETRRLHSAAISGNQRQSAAIKLDACTPRHSAAISGNQTRRLHSAAIRCLRVHLELDDWVLEVRALQRPPFTQPKCTVEVPFVREQVAVLQYLMRECNQA